MPAIVSRKRRIRIVVQGVRSIGKAEAGKRPGSNSSRRRVPEDLVLLKLKANRQTGFEDPGGQLGRVELERRPRSTERGTRRSNRWLGHLGRPGEIGLVADDELHLVGRLQAVQVAPDVGVNFAEPGVLTSRMIRTRGSTRLVSIAPLVSSKTVLPASASRVIRG